MAGGHQTLKHDPAIERWYLMRENVYQHFKLTPVVTRKVVAWGLAAPLLCGLLAWKADLRWDWAVKKKGESLLAKPKGNVE
ncbi:hypothetical protein BOTBODRAFT_29445 [Botryobasidium botryosum FD-172 SS1]|uniref:Complex I-B15 n=1 Tax=Botryobasidium botryosum (strain FD-172 SS1) TaxID=930990 RepID=A0A067MR96_BOTB1|nr:hypothetical protein BOTBODRAFT_29445 [Botryobasidium botryosum FD-172 SS1]